MTLYINTLIVFLFVLLHEFTGVLLVMGLTVQPEHYCQGSCPWPPNIHTFTVCQLQIYKGICIIKVQYQLRCDLLY